jgi:hypothetical protein
MGFLTTETLISRVVEVAHQKEWRSLYPVTMPNVPGIHPVRVPVLLDRRVAAVRPGQPKISALAHEITQSNPDAVVISDGVQGR